MKIFTGLMTCGLICLLTISSMTFGGQKYAVASGTWDATSTWSTTRGGTSGASAPSSSDTVWIPAPYVVTLSASGKNCYNLIIENGGALIADQMNPNTNQRYVRINGDYLQNDGIIGYDPAKGQDSVTAISVEAYRANSTMTIKGTGISKISRIRPGNNLSNITIVIDQNVTLTYTGSTGTGGAGYYTFQGTGANNNLVIKAGRTFTLVDQCNLCTNSSTDTDGPNSSIQVDGILSMKGPNSVLSLRPNTGATVSLIVNGTVEVGGSFKPSGKTSSDPSVITVNTGGILKVGTTGGTNTAYFDAPNQTVTGAGTFQFVGGTLLTCSAAGLDSVNGPIRTATRLFSTDAGYTFTGTAAAIATGRDFPAKAKYVTINDSASVLTLTNDLAVDTLKLNYANLATGSKTLTISPNGGIVRSTGYVIGNLKKQIATGSVSQTFEVGSANGYSPVTLDFNNVTAGGTITVAANQTVHPNAVAPTTHLKRYWTITNTGTAFDKYNSTFSYLPSDFNTGVSESSDESGLQIAKYSASAWTIPTIGTRTPGLANDGGSLQATGLTSFSDFAIVKGAKQDTTPVVLTIAQARQLAAKSKVTVTGKVISPNLHATKNSYYIVDATAGINVYGGVRTDLVLGDSVTVTGWLSLYNGLLEIADSSTSNPLTITKLSSGTVVSPVEVTIAQLNTNGEAYEGRLVKVKNLSKATSSAVWPAAGASATMTFTATGSTDTLALRLDKLSEIPGKTEPVWPQDITGVITQYTTTGTGGYQLLPRYMTDFTPSAPVTDGKLTIAQARALTANSKVTVVGSIISPNLSSSRCGYYISDSTAAVYVYGGTKAAYEIGDTVKVTGWLLLYNGLLEVADSSTSNLATVTKIASGTAPKPIELTIAQFNSKGETYEGRLVKVKNLAKASFSLPWPTTVASVNMSFMTPGSPDTLSVRINSYTEVPSKPEPVWPADITGILTQFSVTGVGGYQLIPRFMTDFDKTTGVDHKSEKIPATYALDQNYPNPFNPSTKISFDLRTNANVTLRIYSLIGQEVATLANNKAMAAGHQSLLFNATNLPSGIYLYRLEVKGIDGSNFSSMKKMMLIK